MAARDASARVGDTATPRARAEAAFRRSAAEWKAIQRLRGAVEEPPVRAKFVLPPNFNFAMRDLQTRDKCWLHMVMVGARASKICKAGAKARFRAAARELAMVQGSPRTVTKRREREASRFLTIALRRALRRRAADRVLLFLKKHSFLEARMVDKFLDTMRKLKQCQRRIKGFAAARKATEGRAVE